ncbi:MAG: acylneuraminate cytidylyltransferase family protein [Trueperaceae bacterium]|nr:acylneuraminate cytidylyltransferase family protein [Trueperaceae bacterium]
MITDLRVLAVIPARGGSKGIPRKNLADLAGRPLIAWTIAAALASRYLDRVIVSTDDREIAEASVEHGAEVPFLRPASLATDSSPTVDVLLHAIRSLDSTFDIVVTLQPTSPLRTTGLIDSAIERLVASGATSCVSVKRLKADASWMYTLDGDGAYVPLLPSAREVARRQDARPVYVLDGSVYATQRSALELTRSVRPEPCVLVENTEASIDIDESVDLRVAHALLLPGSREA